MAKTSKPSLAETHPEIAAQAVGWDPTMLSAGSNRKVRWLCELGHTWDARIFDRLRFASGCQVCANRVVLEGFNDLATTHPELAAQADGWDPRTVHKGISRKVDWICGKGHKWKSVVVARTSQEQGCPVCSGHQVLPGFNDLVTTHPELAQEAHGWDPSHFSHGSGAKKNWKCNLGHKFESQISARSSGNGCPICSGRHLQVGFNDLATKFPEIALEADGWDPRKFHSGTSEKSLGFVHSDINILQQ